MNVEQVIMILLVVVFVMTVIYWISVLIKRFKKELKNYFKKKEYNNELKNRLKYDYDIDSVCLVIKKSRRGKGLVKENSYLENLLHYDYNFKGKINQPFVDGEEVNSHKDKKFPMYESYEIYDIELFQELLKYKK